MSVFIKGLLALLTAFSGFSPPLTVTGQCASDEKKVNKVFCYHSLQSNQSLYSYNIKDVHEAANIDWSDYKGKVVLVVNVASFWGSTHQYPALNALQDSFRDFKILGVPCNQFALVSICVMWKVYFVYAYCLRIVEFDQENWVFSTNAMSVTTRLYYGSALI